MRRWLHFITIALLLASAAAGCTEDDPAPLFMDIRYQVRCVECEPRAPDDPVRDVQLLDGEMGFTIECFANTRDGDRLLSFSTVFINPDAASENYSIEVEQVNLDKSDPGSDCLVSVREGSNTYAGDCTKDDPTEDEPCSVSFDIEDDIVNGTIFCADIPNRNMAMTRRHVVAPGTQDEPAEFELHGCTGL
jgi:hypothetical protein